MILDSLENGKQKIMFEYPFVQAFLVQSINEDEFVKNLMKFKKDLISKGITNADISNLTLRAENSKWERKNTFRRENLLRKIIAAFTDLLKTRFKEEGENFIFTYKIVTKTKSILGGFTDVPISLSPTYGIFLTSKRNKEKYLIMLLHKQDLDSRKYFNFSLQLEALCKLIL
jgi:hypothetical protein